MNHVLLIDDDQRFAADAVDCLRDDGYSVQWQRHCELHDLTQLADAASLPDVVILDFSKPSHARLQLYRDIKTLDSPPHIIVMNAGNALEQADDFGADSRIDKTRGASELVPVVRRAKAEMERFKELNQQVALARSAAFVAMSTSSRIGQVVRFMQATLAAKTARDIATSLFEILGNMSLYGTVGMAIGREREYFSDRELNCGEVDILTGQVSAARIVEDGPTMIFNYPRCALLIRNAPQDDPDVRGQLRDDLCILVEAIDARCASIMLERETESKNDLLSTSLHVLGRMVEETDAFNLDFTQRSSALIDALLLNMNLEFSVIDFSEAEEEKLTELLNETSAGLGLLFDEKRERDEIMKKIMQKLLQMIAV